MGTNYYFKSQNIKMLQKNFPCMVCPNGRIDDGYTVDMPYDRKYLFVHIGKTSYGWVPLLEIHDKAYHTFSEMKEFYNAHKESLEIVDEYGEKFSWNEFENMLITHSQRKPEPMKWAYEENQFFSKDGKILQTVPCSEEEAELHIPFRHDEYFKTEKNAHMRFDVPYAFSTIQNEHDIPYRDGLYDFDWSYGTFA